MTIDEILKTKGCELLNDWLMLNCGCTLEDCIPQIQEARDNPDDFDELVVLVEGDRP